MELFNKYASSIVKLSWAKLTPNVYIIYDIENKSLLQGYYYCNTQRNLR